jgi:septal ring factor EnvC (AmiA/AmiB activator)
MATERLDTVEDRLDRVEVVLQSATRQTAENARQLARTIEAVDRLANVQLQLAQIFDQDCQRMSRAIDSINAAVERLVRHKLQL